MKYYNKDGQEFEFDLEHSYPIGAGKFAIVYGINKDECIKVYQKDCPIDIHLLEEIKNYHLFHYDALKDILFTDDGKIGCFLMKKYKRELPDFYIMEVKDFLREFNTLDRDAKVLSENSIFINDTKTKNTMSYRNRLKMVDYDMYRRSINPNVANSNRKLLLWLWHDIFCEQRINNGYSNIFKENIIEPFFNPSSGNLDMVREKLEGKKLVIDGFIRGK